METEEITFRKFVFDMLHEGRAFHGYRMTTGAKNALADQIAEVHLDLLNEAEDAVRDELEASYAEFLPEPEPEPEEEDVEIEYKEPPSTVTVEVVKKK